MRTETEMFIRNVALASKTLRDIQDELDAEAEFERIWEVLRAS